MQTAKERRAEILVDTPDVDGAGWLLRVTDLKQYAYCPRVVYYEYCLPGLRPSTHKMDAGIAAGDRAAGLEERRSLRAYGLTEGDRSFNVTVTSHRLGITGQVDMVIRTAGQNGPRIVPVDYKLSRRKPGQHFRLQLACYALLLEEAFERPAPEGFLYLIPARRAERVVLDQRLRKRALRSVAQIRALVEQQHMPAPVKQRTRCVDCEFRRFCNDVV